MIKQEDYVGSKTPYDRYVSLVNEARAKGHTHWINDEIPVAHNILKFYNELKHKRPDIVVRFDTHASFYNGKDYRVFADLGIAYKDCPEIQVGIIGLENDGGAHGELMYTVTSDRIANEKYASYSKGYKTKKTKNFSNAVKNAVQFLKPMLFEEMKSKHDLEFNSAIENLRAPSKEKLYGVSNMGRHIIIDEIRNMVRMGYVPITPSFIDAMQVLKAEDAEIQTVLNYKPKSCFVWAKKDKVEYQIEGDERKVVYNLQDVPEDIMNKVSVLQIGSEGKPIMDVGVKIDNTTYWIFL
jgi:hypothetical protein